MVMPVFLPRRRAGRLRGDQGALARHRRQGPVLHRHRRRLPGGHDLPGREAVLGAGALVEDIYRMAVANSRVPKMVAGDINAEVVGVRTGAAALVRVVERYGLERFRECVGAHVRPRRGGRALRGSRRCPTAATSATARWTPTASTDDRVPFEVVVEIDGSTRAARLHRTRPPQQAGPINCPLPSTVSASRIAITHAGRRRRGAERGPLPRDRGRHASRARCSTRCTRRPASSTAGPATRRSR